MLFVLNSYFSASNAACELVTMNTLLIDIPSYIDGNDKLAELIQDNSELFCSAMDLDVSQHDDRATIDDVTITSSTPVCATPTNLAVNGVTSSTATATWSAGGTETQWEIAYKPTASATWMTAFVSPVAT